MGKQILNRFRWVLMATVNLRRLLKKKNNNKQYKYNLPCWYVCIPYI